MLLETQFSLSQIGIGDHNSLLSQNNTAGQLRANNVIKASMNTACHLLDGKRTEPQKNNIDHKFTPAIEE
jgi:hypothetical protein